MLEIIVFNFTEKIAMYTVYMNLVAFNGKRTE